jgi:uncharacterized membrane protein YqjE
MSDAATNGRESPGAGDAARGVVEHARNIVKLELELAAIELKQKVGRFATGGAFLVAGALLGALAVLFLLAAATAALATAVPVWAALLIMGGAFVLLAAAGALAGMRLVKRSAPAVPERAIAEAKRTSEALRQ